MALFAQLQAEPTGVTSSSSRPTSSRPTSALGLTPLGRLELPPAFGNGGYPSPAFSFTTHAQGVAGAACAAAAAASSSRISSEE